ncbi:hypothetical protein THRCLA_22383 [Thraustotheca clavata]|uniref:CW-type domain-containing protein n=1 Tax=Thraustotheca clavata TaxID=74557 RepID=A0A1V9Z3B0_9STRA|nr:hypothetical protein THRCLA_22383 [Thraustotheca clavata]
MKREKKRSRGSDDGIESKADTESTNIAAVSTPQSAEDSPSPKEFKKVQLNITIPDKDDTGSNKDVNTRDKKKKKKKRPSSSRQAEDNVEDIEEQEAKWVQCDSCRKWRTVPQELDLEAMPEKWYCRMNHWDKMYASCDVPEEVVQPKKKKVKTETSGDAPSPSAVLLTTSITEREKKLTKKEQKKQSVKTLEKEIKWVQCENVNCGKWRVVPPNIDESSLPTKWYCHLNTWSPDLAHCHAENPPEVESVLNKKTTKPKRTKESARSPRLSLTSLDATPDVDTPTSTSASQSQPLSTTGASSTKAPFGDKKQKVKKAILEWAQCEKCNKWRKLPHHVKPSTLPDKWYCSMNHWNVALANCSAPQEEDNEPFSHDPNDYPKTPFPKKKGKLSYRELIYGGNGHIRKAYTEESSTLSFECDGKIYHRDDMYRNSSMYQPRVPLDYPHNQKHDAPSAEAIDVVLSMEESVACQKQILRVLHDTTKCRSTLDIVLELNSEAFASGMVFSYPIVQKCLASMVEQGMVESSKEETIVKVTMPLEISTYAKAYYVAGENNHDIRTWEERRPQPQVRYRRKINYRPPLKLAKPWKQKGFLGLPT